MNIISCDHEIVIGTHDIECKVIFFIIIKHWFWFISVFRWLNNLEQDNLELKISSNDNLNLNLFVSVIFKMTFKAHTLFKSLEIKQHQYKRFLEYNMIAWEKRLTRKKWFSEACFDYMKLDQVVRAFFLVGLHKWQTKASFGIETLMHI